MGQSIYNSHKRVTWLSFWTVSGPLKSEPQQASTLLQPRIRGRGLGRCADRPVSSTRRRIKPDWVIFDPEGYPDNHSGLDAPGGSSTATIRAVRHLLECDVEGLGQRHGLGRPDAQRRRVRQSIRVPQLQPRHPVDARLRGRRLRQRRVRFRSRERAVPNIRGYISFSASCSPVSTLQQEEATLLNPPWSGQFNTLQFNAGVYCAPPRRRLAP